MNTSKHTPGPWTLEPAMKNQDCGWRIHTPESAPYGMAHIYSPGNQNEFNAKLISKSPDLLKLLSEITNSATINGAGNYEVAPALIREAKELLKTL